MLMLGVGMTSEETAIDDVTSPAANSLQAADETYLMDHPDSTEEIPILDISPALSGTEGLASVAGELTFGQIL
jgi:hypothetical protein